MHICTVIKEKVQSLQTERNEYVFKRDLNDDSDGAHVTSFGIEFQTEEEAKEKCCLTMCRSIEKMYGELTVACVMAFSAAWQRHMIVQYCMTLKFLSKIISIEHGTFILINSPQFISAWHLDSYQKNNWLGMTLTYRSIASNILQHGTYIPINSQLQWPKHTCFIINYWCV